MVTLAMQVQRQFKHLNIPDLSDAVLRLNLQPGATINRNRLNSIFFFVCYTRCVRWQFKHLNSTNLGDNVLTLHFQPSATITRNRFNRIFSSLVTLVIPVRVRIDL